MALSSLHAGTSHFNDAQLAAVQADDGPMLIEAGPGAGKTTVLTWRAVYLLQQLRVAPERICVVTFTRAAAEQLRDRIHSLAPSRGRSIRAATIHSLAATLLRRRGRLTGKERFLSDHEQLDVVRELLRRESVPMTDELPGELLSEMGAARNRMQAPQAFEPQSVDKEVFVRVAQQYRAWKRDERYLDYDDLLVHLYVLLQEGLSHSEEESGDPSDGRFGQHDGRILQQEFDHLLVDEFQDTSMLQYEILRMLAAPHGRLYVVGDVDQAIYSWRGAGPEVFMRFGKDYPATGRVVLDRNYRASARLVEVTNSLIEHNENRTPKRIRSAAEGGQPPTVLTPGDDAAEGEAVAARLQRANEKEHIPWREMAVIYRNNYQALPFIAELSRQGIPFRMLGEPPNPFRHWVGQDVLAYVQLAMGPIDPQLVERIMYRPNRYISTAATRSVAHLLRSGETLTDAYATLDMRSFQLDRITQLEQHLWRLARLSPAEGIAFVRKTIGYDEYLNERFAASPARRSESTAMAALLQTVAVNSPTLADFLDFAEEAQRLPKGWWRLLVETAVESVNGERPDAVTLTTCHSAKGLEFDVVVVTGLVEGMLPGVTAERKEQSAAKRSTETSPADRSHPELEEERRLAYVAMTRARHELVLSAPSQLLGEKRTPSRFLYEATGMEPPEPVAGGAATVKGAGGGASATDKPAPDGWATAKFVTATGPSADELAALVEETVARFAVGTQVAHKTFGRGEVVALDKATGYIDIKFEHYGDKQLLLQACVEKELLERVD